MTESTENKNKKKHKGREGFVKSLISGSLLSERLILGNLTYMILLTVLGALYIANRFHAEKVIRRTDELQKEVKELRAEALSTSSDFKESRSKASR